MSIQELLQDSSYTEKRVLENLICLVFEITREQLWLQLDTVLTSQQEHQILEYYRQYVEEKKPLEYIMGYVEFLGYSFILDERSLIPRPETEYMIQAVNEYVVTASLEDKKILVDVGTGSGVLGLSVLLYNPDFFSGGYLLDYSQDALDLAKKNVTQYQSSFSTPVELLHSDLLSVLLADSDKYFDHTTLILLANLPYIPDDMFEQNVGDNVKNWEPRMAFVGGDDGLIFYRRMFDQLFQEQKKHQFKVVMFLEMMTWQVEILQKEFSDKFIFEEVKTFHFNIRIVKATLLPH